MLNEIDLSRADLNLLVVFEAVLAEGHVGRAATRLSLSPSAISHGLGRLRRLLNDPLFLRTPKGVIPTARATELAQPVADILARVRSVVASAAPFDPGRSVRRFTLGAADGISAVLLPSLLAALRATAPGIDLSVRHLFPSSVRVWDTAIAELEAHEMDIAIVPVNEVPVRFAERVLYEDDFIIAMRAGHPFADDPSLERYCEARHLLVSVSGEPHGFVDVSLARQNLKRRIALTVPNFMHALALVAETDLIAALPRRFVAMHAERFGVVAVEAPMSLDSFRIRAVVPKVALMDAGVAWLFTTLEEAMHVGERKSPGPRSRVRRKAAGVS
jgi:DNA-binding transcriptional LysR family regulator